jgi:formylmethanofuran dehydrogenase subunit E
MRYYSDNPERDFLRHDAEQQRKLDRLPKCAYCGEPITTEECYEIGGNLLCPDCLVDRHRKWVDDLIEY